MKCRMRVEISRTHGAVVIVAMPAPGMTLDDLHNGIVSDYADRGRVILEMASQKPVARNHVTHKTAFIEGLAAGIRQAKDLAVMKDVSRLPTAEQEWLASDTRRDIEG